MQKEEKHPELVPIDMAPDGMCQCTGQARGFSFVHSCETRKHLKPGDAWCNTCRDWKKDATTP